MVDKNDTKTIVNTNEENIYTSGTSYITLLKNEKILLFVKVKLEWHEAEIYENFELQPILIIFIKIVIVTQQNIFEHNTTQGEQDNMTLLMDWNDIQG